jgi:hypothetical protein
MENIGHQSLESHILHTGDIFGSFEIFRGTVRSTLSRIIDEVLCNFAQSSAFFAEVDDYPTASLEKSVLLQQYIGPS